MAQPKVPITMLSGFLGAGKTTLLRELLTQSKYKVGCIVNDVAAVNIDAKLIRNQQGAEKEVSTADLAPTVELQNGCACCSIQDELFLSFEQILSVGARNGVQYDRIVLENSGVAEPLNLREAFVEAQEYGHPVMQKITVVDSHTFIQEYACRNPVATRPDLGGDESSLRPVVDLLVEQIETADYVLLNKVDMLSEGQLPELIDIIKSINPLCDVVSGSHGKVDLEQLFGPGAKALLAALNTEGQHRGYIAASRQEEAVHNNHSHNAGTNGEQQNEQQNGCSKSATAGGAVDGDDRTHKHGSGESASGHAHDDHKHEHGESHHHDHHDHHHGHHHDHHHHHHHDGHDHDHDHDHKHDYDTDATTAEKRFGITSFVYTRRRPFHPQRLKETVLKWMPVTSNKETGAAAPADNSSPIKAVVRSKGFMWLSHGHTTAFYWSHAGQHFEIREEGDWWAAVPDLDWPQQKEPRDLIFSDFEGPHGDRRQEIVFIGIAMDRPAIEAALDSALLTDEELGKYEANWAKLPDPPHAGGPASVDRQRSRDLARALA